MLRAFQFVDHRNGVILNRNIAMAGGVYQKLVASEAEFSPYIVFLLAFGGLPEIAVVKYRSINTTLGGLFALLAYGLWPVTRVGRKVS